MEFVTWDLKQKYQIVMLIVGLSSLLVGSAFAEKRIALVIGNSAYENVSPLANPKNDADLMVTTLQEAGFEVVSATDVNYRDMRKAVKTFGQKLRASGEDTVGLFYYAGHGVQANGTNYLIPLETEIESQSDLDLEALDAGDILGQMEDAGNRLNLVILDACRNNPFKSSMRSSGRGLARMSAARGSLIAFATAPGQVAADGIGRNSPYTIALVEAIKQPGLAVEQVFKRARVNVGKSTGKRQTPWEESSLEGNFYFVPAETTKSTKTPASPFSEAERIWDQIKTTQSIVVLSKFAVTYKDSFFATLAQQRIDQIRREKKQATSVDKLKDNENTDPVINSDIEIADRASIREIQLKLFNLNFEPGTIDGVMGAKTKLAIREFQASKDQEKSGKATSRLLTLLRKTKTPENWAGIGFLISKKLVFKKSGMPDRKSTQTQLSKSCQGCSEILVFSANECGALAMSSKGWGWAVRDNRKATEIAAVNSCQIHGGKCKLKTILCASGN